MTRCPRQRPPGPRTTALLLLTLAGSALASPGPTTTAGPPGGGEGVAARCDPPRGRAPAADDAQAPGQAFARQLTLGWTLYLRGRLAESVAAYRRASVLAPDAVEPLLGATLPLMAARRWQAALLLSRAVLSRAPGSRLARARAAWSLYNLGRPDEAARGFAELLESDPGDRQAKNGQGLSLLRLGRAEQAAQAFAQVLAADPRDPLARDGLRLARLRVRPAVVQPAPGPERPAAAPRR